ncbi:hypothetical protein [Flavobacterium sp.]|uniref:hypothetical protein n=1 Tax=Flavobacterium sp. TaxID=239 RepID=UPI002638C174|nr:hypothetical protein [Flavobacterium sp.]
MRNIILLDLEKHKNQSQYKLVEKGIYQDLTDEDETNYRVAFSFELEDNEDSQYPLEDILDKYCLYVSDFPDSEDNSGNILKIEFGGEYRDIKKVTEIVGKHVYNKEYEEGGETYVKLIIE